jgi:hypothetical protein
MDYPAVEEMVADWLGACCAYRGGWPESLEEWIWFKKNFNKIRIHQATRSYILFILKGYFKNN